MFVHKLSWPTKLDETSDYKPDYTSLKVSVVLFNPISELLDYITGFQNKKYKPIYFIVFGF